MGLRIRGWSQGENNLDLLALHLVSLLNPWKQYGNRPCWTALVICRSVRCGASFRSADPGPCQPESNLTDGVQKCRLLPAA